MKLKETIVILALVASVFYGAFALTADVTTSHTPPAQVVGNFVVVHLESQVVAIPKPNATPLAQPVNQDQDKWQNPRQHDASDEPENGFGAKILGPLSVALLLLAITLWAMYEVGRKRREAEQKNKQSKAGKQ